jgi:hypothetical protein
MTKINMTIKIEATVPKNLSVEEFIDFLSVQSCDVEANILNMELVSVENK